MNHQNHFAVLYSFKVKPDKDESFKEAWRELTTLISVHEGGLGSRLHYEGEHHYIAYAMWPDRDTWANSGSHLPESADVFRQQMREACEEIKTIHELTVAEDLIQTG